MNEINLETEKRKLKDRGIMLAEQGLFVGVPRISSVPPDGGGFVLEVQCKLPATFPILSFDARHEIERNLKRTLTGYSIGVYVLPRFTRVRSKSQQKTILGREVHVDFGYHVGEDNWNWLLFSFRIHEAVILQESRRLITCDIWWGGRAERIPDQIVPVTTNYIITTINDAETPIYRTDVIKNFKTYDCVRIDVHRHKIHQQKWYESAFSVATAIATDQVFRKEDITYRGLQLSGVGISFPLNKTNSVYFVFTESRSE